MVWYNGIVGKPTRKKTDTMTITRHNRYGKVYPTHGYTEPQHSAVRTVTAEEVQAERTQTVDLIGLANANRRLNPLGISVASDATGGYELRGQYGAPIYVKSLNDVIALGVTLGWKPPVKS